MAASTSMVLATRRFSIADQGAFARVTGDFNPLHVDQAWAATVFPGEVVVHGVHAVLWGCNAYLIQYPGRPLGTLRAVFDKPILLNEDVSVTAEETADGVHISFTVRGVKLARATMTWAAHAAFPAPAQLAPGPPALATRNIQGTQALSGQLILPRSATELVQLFPAFAASAGTTATIGIASLSTLVGMECPGRYGLFNSFDVSLTDADGPLTYQVTKADTRFNRVAMDVRGYGLTGKVAAFLMDASPCAPAETAAVDPVEFKGQQPLVIGASSGLGRATAALLAAGGAEPVITHRASQRAIEELSAQIAAHGGRSLALPYQTGEAEVLAAELASRGWSGRHVYFFATPRISRRRLEAYQPELLHTFTAVYVDGFEALVRTLADTFPGRAFRFFYPSSIFADGQKTDLIEYGEAKRAGEQLCAALQAAYPHFHFHVERLPGIGTRQTVAITPTSVQAAEDVMLPLIRAVQSAR